MEMFFRPLSLSSAHPFSTRLLSVRPFALGLYPCFVVSLTVTEVESVAQRKKNINDSYNEVIRLAKVNILLGSFLLELFFQAFEIFMVSLSDLLVFVSEVCITFYFYCLSSARSPVRNVTRIWRMPFSSLPSMENVRTLTNGCWIRRNS